MRQIVRTQLLEDEMSDDSVFLIDGIVSGVRGGAEHKKLVLDLLSFPAPKIIEHPDIFLREFNLDRGLLDYTLELRRNPDEVIDYQLVSQSFSAFDIS
jgi:hypothetical protein